MQRNEKVCGHWLDNVFERCKVAANPLDGCLHVFLAIGSGSVLPIRKLYEQNNFPLSPMQAHFDKVFGNGDERNLKNICTVSTVS